MKRRKNTTPRHQALEYLISLSAVSASILAREVFAYWFGPGVPRYLFLLPSVMLIAFTLGPRQGYFCTLASSLAAWHWVLPPKRTLLTTNPVDALGLALFFVVGICLCLIARSYRRAIDKEAAYEKEVSLQQSQEELRRSRERFHLLAQATNDAIWDWKAEKNQIWWSDAIRTHFGWEIEQYKTTLAWKLDRVHPQDRPKVEAEINALMQGTTGEWRCEYRMQTASGSYRNVYDRVLILRDNTGLAIRILGAVTDITEQKHALEQARLSEEQLRTALTAAAGTSWKWDPSPDAQNYWTPDHARFFGWESKIGMPFAEVWFSILHPEDVPVARQAIQQARDKGADIYLEYRVRMQDGSIRWFLSRGRLHRSLNDHDQGRYFGVVIDITERKLREEQLRLSQQRLSMALRSGASGAWEWNLGTGAGWWSPELYELWGVPLGTPITSDLINQKFDSRDREKILLIVDQSLKTNTDLHFEHRIQHPEHGERWLRTHARIAYQDGVPSRLVGISTDITEIRSTQQHLEESEERFRTLFQSLPVGALVIDPKTHRSLLYNKSSAYMLGYSYDEFKDLPLEAIEAEHTPEIIERNFSRMLAGDQLSFDTKLQTKDGQKRDVRVIAQKTQISDQPLLLSLLVDVTERKQAEEQIRIKEARWATTLQSIGDAVISTDIEGRIEFMNKVAESLTGWSLEKAKGEPLHQIFHLIDETTGETIESPVYKVIREGKIVGLSNHTSLRRRDGTELCIEDTAAPIFDEYQRMSGIVLVFHDTTAKKKAEKLLQNNDRLATTGKLAASLAHEIHNPLDSVSNLLYLMKSTNNPDLLEKYIAMASSELDRVTQMIRHMLAFQREATKPVPVKIRDVLDNVAALFNRKLEDNRVQLTLKVDFEGEFLGLPGEMRQVFANLLGNAIEAVGRSGAIYIHARFGHDWVQDRLGLRVYILDNGPGVPPKIRQTIFEPFFTTKGESGTGLGLWITAGIIKNHQGSIRLHTSTQPGRSGTCFAVFFPSLDSQKDTHNQERAMA